MKNNLLSERLVYNGESQTPTHLHLCTYNALVMQEVSGVNFQTVANSLNREQINWLQVHGLQNTEVIREICSHFEIDFLILQDILNAEHPTKIEEHDKYTVLIMKLFRFNNKEVGFVFQEGEYKVASLDDAYLLLFQFIQFIFRAFLFFDDVTSALHNDVQKYGADKATTCSVSY